MSTYTVRQSPHNADTPMSCSLADLQLVRGVARESREREEAANTHALVSHAPSAARVSPAPSGPVGNRLLPVGCRLRSRAAPSRSSQTKVPRRDSLQYVCLVTHPAAARYITNYVAARADPRRRKWAYYTTVQLTGSGG